ncbi:MAG: hypothetical protein ACK524_04595, partial [Planctomyces sp.]
MRITGLFFCGGPGAISGGRCVRAWDGWCRSGCPPVSACNASREAAKTNAPNWQLATQSSPRPFQGRG